MSEHQSGDELGHLDDAAVYEQLEAAKKAMSRDLLRNPVTLARGLDPTFRMRPHLAVIGQALVGVERGDYDRLLIVTPPQVGKSTCVAEWFPYWWLCVHPEDRVAVTSYSDDLALKRGRVIRSYVEEYGDEYELFMRAGSGAMQDWEVTSGGGVRSVSVGKGLTGNAVNLLLIDDPHKDRADAESEASRRALHDWYSSTALKRLQPDRNAVVAIMTRWHPDDFAGRRLSDEGRLEDGGRWKVVHLPAIADPGKFGPDPLGREYGDPLPHPKIPTRDRRALLAWWADMKRTSIVRDWHSLAQGDPQPAEGALVSDELLRLIRDPGDGVEPQKIAVAVDPSGGGRDTAGVVGGFLGDDNRVWITHDISKAMSSTDWSTAACRLAHETNAAIIYVEQNYGRDMCELAIRTSWETLQRDGEIPAKVLMPAIDLVQAKQGKLLRAEPVAQQMVQDRVRLRGVFTDLEREWSSWMPTDPNSPGRIDASCILVYGLIPEANKGAIVHAPLPQAPQAGGGRQPSQAAGAYVRRIAK
ncbi:terminase large subunit domain-containing protein [Streptomyces sp. NBC_01763]|uniref:terminase large subunit domain-containing protein n=1 Tax=Streptomyces sp. NBC_01763 TaxID=2975934 RepID=UPI002DD9D0D1|nr:terminase family protein [Streptomyces sp. NBC_01763]WSC35611.1 terminase family protein [Streptomyces sp. NBC_01763]